MTISHVAVDGMLFAAGDFRVTRFSFTLPTAGHARLTIVDLAGRVVATLADGPFAAGEHQARWSSSAPAGVYFARLEAPGGVSRVTRVVRFE